MMVRLTPSLKLRKMLDKISLKQLRRNKSLASLVSGALLCVCLVFITISLIHSDSKFYKPGEIDYSYHSPDSESSPVRSGQFESLKKILYFNKYFHLTDWRFGFGQEPFISSNCPVTNCYVTDDRSLLSSISEYDAILFHARDMDKRVIQVPNQERRKQNQVYVFFLMESPLNDGLNYTNKRFHNFFNWTMTYRLDSDIYRPYGWLSESNSEEVYPSPKLQWMTPPEMGTEQIRTKHKKTKMVAWIVSNCNTHSNREDYVELLKKHVEVDTFGACGDRECGRAEDHNSQECNNMLEGEYRFYLSFENSFCAGYVTEKFYKALSIDIIPIVMGGADYTEHAPPQSYINVLDYESPKDLADYLIHLANNREEYEAYFWWKKHYKVHSDERGRAAQSMCKLCEKLNEGSIETKSYETLGKWWWGGGKCKNKGHVPWYRPKSKWSDKILQFLPAG